MRKPAQNEMQGAARQAKGKVKQETGRITRNRSLQAKGALEKNVGKAQRAATRATRKAENERNS